MFTVFVMMLLGVGTGIVFRTIPAIGHTSKLISVIICALLFLLGTEVGGNERIINHMGTLGVQALVITLAAIAGSACCAKIIHYYMQDKHER